MTSLDFPSFIRMYVHIHIYKHQNCTIKINLSHVKKGNISNTQNYVALETSEYEQRLKLFYYMENNFTQLPLLYGAKFHTICVNI